MSNEVMRQSMHDASALVSKQRKLPHTHLDIWKFRRFSNPCRSLTDPLIPFCSPVRQKLPSEAHAHCYAHRQGRSLPKSVRKLSGFLLPGESYGKIWMWYRCLCCPRINGFPPATKRVVMSDATWGLSFGKFFELSFSNHAAASRVASCGHSLHRDCLCFYGFGRMVACFCYAPIHLHFVSLPPQKFDFSYQHQDWIKKEANEVADKTEILFRELLNALCQLAERKSNSGSLIINDTDCRRTIVELDVGKKELEVGGNVLSIFDLRPRRLDIKQIDLVPNCPGRFGISHQGYIGFSADVWSCKFILIFMVGYLLRKILIHHVFNTYVVPALIPSRRSRG